MRRAVPVLALVLALALAATVAACGGSSSSGSAAPSGGAVEIVKGAEMFSEFCAGCHGPDGSGGAGGPAVTGQTDATQVAAVVRDGSGSMPGLADEMSADQITAVSQYLVDRLK
jgi:mono/diheme cytochrome c family protein